jgi:hypothetical protein
MRVYDLRLEEGIASLAVPGRADRDWLHQMVRGVSLASRWHPIVVEPIVPEGRGLTDVMPLDTVDLALSATAARALLDVVEGFAEALPLGGYPAGYSLFNVTHVVDALDLDRSKVTYTADGRIDKIVQHAFVPEKLRRVPVFKLPQRPRSSVYVTDPFVDRVTQAELRGFAFGTPLWTDES